MPRLTEQDKVLMLSNLEEEWSIRKIATHNGLNKRSTVSISKEEMGTRRDREKKTDHNFLNCCLCHL
jgi:hypothetical protein